MTGELPAGLVIEGRRAIYRPAGSVSFEQAVELVRSAIKLARINGAAELLVDSTALSGFPSPDTFERFLAAVEWAQAANQRLRLAMVVRAELIDPQKFGVTVMANRGLRANVFPTETEALAWLGGKVV